MSSSQISTAEEKSESAMCANANVTFFSLSPPVEMDIAERAASTSPRQRKSRAFCVTSLEAEAELSDGGDKVDKNRAAPSRSSISTSALATRIPSSWRRVDQNSISFSNASFVSPEVDIEERDFLREVSVKRASRASS